MNDEIIQLIDIMDGRQKYDAMCKAFFRYREGVDTKGGSRRI